MEACQKWNSRCIAWTGPQTTEPHTARSEKDRNWRVRVIIRVPVVIQVYLLSCPDPASSPSGALSQIPKSKP